MSTMLIKNGRVIDGTGAASINADVLVKDGKIAAIGYLLQVTENA